MMASFRQDYLALLESRVDTVCRLVAAEQVEPARVALLSLESSSAMLGVDELVVAARQLRAALGDGRHDALDPLVAQLVSEADAARARLDRSS